MSNKFFVVRDPTPDSTPEEVLMTFDTYNHARYVIGCGLEQYEREKHVLHLTRDAAVVDADSRVSRAVAKLQALRNGSPERPDKTALWAALRGQVSLSEVVDMVRQDLEAETVDTGEAQGLANRLIASVERVQNV